MQFGARAMCRGQPASQSAIFFLFVCVAWAFQVNSHATPRHAHRTEIAHATQIKLKPAHPN